MIAIPAVDIRGGYCVQVRSEAFAAQAVRTSEPCAVAREWASRGFRRLHLTDLDAAAGRGSNARVLCDILGDEDAEVQVGGGARTPDVVERLIDEGARWVIIGASALEDASWVEEIAAAFPGALIIAANVRNRRVVTRGREPAWPRMLSDVIEELNSLPLGGVMVTAIDREGQLQGTDLALMEDAAEESAHPIIAAGGITTMNELRGLAERGVSGAVVGTALYSGVLDAREVGAEFAE